MNQIDLFYILKPFIPRKMQIAIRQTFALAKTKKNVDRWPIWPIAGQIPKNWPGWPGNKKFAFVLIHDVDTKEGLDNCINIVELEKRLGFRSSFNFVPEGYRIDDGIRKQLKHEGFEVGLHGLTHDGRLFRNYHTFSNVIPKINAYLKDWNVAGYTSPAMLSNLKWVAELDIEYSCSSFDTDPLEPRPFGVATIFPFLVSSTSLDRSYVEIPYTLPQDHSLFILLRQNDIRTWESKLHWIAEKGGLALINTHPDYMDFGKEVRSSQKYSWRLYSDFLKHVIYRYEGQYWNCLPITLARFWRTSFPEDVKYVYGETEVSASTRAAIYSKREKLYWKYKLALACTPGGHFEQMQNLADLYRQYPHFWITDRTVQTEHSVGGNANTYFIGSAHFKRPWKYIKQIPQVLRILREERPTHIISTGSGMVVLIPFFLSKLFNICFIHIETFSHVNHLTKMGKLLNRLNHPIYSQWDGVKLKNVFSIGPIMSDLKPFIKPSSKENMVFVTLGTRPQEFKRLVKAVETMINKGVIKDRVVVQMGATRYQTNLMESFDFCNPLDINELIGSSKYVITQESAGIVTKCLKLGKRFIVMPRDYVYDELPTRSDMNEDLHFKLAEMGYTYVVQNQIQLEEAIQTIERLKTGFSFNNKKAITYLQNIIEKS